MVTATQRRRQFRLVSLVSAIIVAWVSFLITWHLSADTYSKHSAVDAAESAAPLGRAPAKRESRAPLRGDESSKSDETATGDFGTSNGVHFGSDSPTPDNTKCTISVLFMTAHNERLGGVAVSTNIFSRQREVSGVYFSQRARQETDAGGLIAVSSATGRCLAIEVVDANWYAEVLELEFGPADKSATVLLEPVSVVRIRAQYDDGLPVTDSGWLRGKGAEGYSAHFAFDSQGCAVIARVPVRPSLRCRVFGGKRTGYSKHEVELDRVQIESGMEILVVVPKSGSMGGIQITFPNGRPAGNSVMHLECESALPSPEYRQVAGGVESFEWANLPTGRRYRLALLGSNCWKSDWIAVEPGKVSKVDAELVASGEVRARLVDGAGQPIAFGALAIADGMSFTFTAGRSAGPATNSISDADGQVLLGGLPPGTTVIEAFSWGTEPVRRQIEIVSGQSVDLGAVMLIVAIGKIRVKLFGAKPGQEFRVSVSLAEPLSAPDVLPPEVATGGHYALEHLPLRSYLVAVFPASGGRVVTATVRLTPGDHDQDVELDVSPIAGSK